MPEKKNNQQMLDNLQKNYDEFLAEINDIKTKSKKIKRKYIKQIEELKKKDLLNKINN